MEKGQDYIGISVVYFCHDGEGQVFLAKRSNECRDEHGRWDIGAGSLEFGDAIEATLRREINEEYGTDVLDYEFLGYRDIHRNHGEQRTHWVTLDFKVLVDRSKARNGEPHKFEEVGWFNVSQLPEPVHSQLPTFLMKYGNKLMYNY